MKKQLIKTSQTILYSLSPKVALIFPLYQDFLLQCFWFRLGRFGGHTIQLPAPDS